MIAVGELAEGFPELILIVKSTESDQAAQLVRFGSRAALCRDIGEPFIPCFQIHLFERAENIGVFDGGIDSVESLQQVIRADDSAKKRKIARFRRAARFHETHIAAGVFRAVDRADSHRVAGLLGFVICQSVFHVAHPRGIAVAPDLAALVMSHEAAGKSALNG